MRSALALSREIRTHLGWNKSEQRGYRSAIDGPPHFMGMARFIYRQNLARYEGLLADMPINCRSRRDSITTALLVC